MTMVSWFVRFVRSSNKLWADGVAKQWRQQRYNPPSAEVFNRFANGVTRSAAEAQTFARVWADLAAVSSAGRLDHLRTLSYRELVVLRTLSIDLVKLAVVPFGLIRWPGLMARLVPWLSATDDTSGFRRRLLPQAFWSPAQVLQAAAELGEAREAAYHNAIGTWLAKLINKSEDGTADDTQSLMTRTLLSIGDPDKRRQQLASGDETGLAELRNAFATHHITVDALSGAHIGALLTAHALPRQLSPPFRRRKRLAMHCYLLWLEDRRLQQARSGGMADLSTRELLAAAALRGLPLPSPSDDKSNRSELEASLQAWCRLTERSVNNASGIAFVLHLPLFLLRRRYNDDRTPPNCSITHFDRDTNLPPLRPFVTK